MYFSVCVSNYRPNAGGRVRPDLLHQGYDLGLTGTSDARLTLADEHVDLGTHTEAIRINTRFDRESSSRNQAAIVVSLVVVHVDAISMNRFTETVPCPVNEVPAVSGAFHDGAAGAVDFEAANLASGADGG